ncbi:DUF2171 domain-containing protein [Acinetobacter sp. TSRC1-2]|uniref:DUF2171 domain-containing protein n=1 Tax=unclassified Acinetobacter TaxID=196816 RepID=UPI003CED5F2C
MATVNVNNITKHADVIALCGTKVGKVNHLEGSYKIKLTRNKAGSHHLITLFWINEIKGNQIRFNIDLKK